MAAALKLFAKLTRRSSVISLLKILPLLRPRTVLPAWTAYVALLPRSWWRRFPFLPLPDRHWMSFRLETAFGPGSVDPHGLVEVIPWGSAMAKVRRRRNATARRASEHGN